MLARGQREVSDVCLGSVVVVVMRKGNVVNMNATVKSGLSGVFASNLGLSSKQLGMKQATRSGEKLEMSVLPKHCQPELHAITLDVENDSLVSRLTRVGLPGPRGLFADSMGGIFITNRRA